MNRRGGVRLVAGLGAIACFCVALRDPSVRPFAVPPIAALVLFLALDLYDTFAQPTRYRVHDAFGRCMQADLDRDRAIGMATRLASALAMPLTVRSDDGREVLEIHPTPTKKGCAP